MENTPGKLKKQMIQSFTSRFESNEHLKERLARIQGGEDSLDAEDLPGLEGDSVALPAVEEMHAKMLAGIREGIEMPQRMSPQKKKKAGTIESRQDDNSME